MEGCNNEVVKMPPVINTAPDATSWPIPKFKLRIDDLDHDGVSLFLAAIKPKYVLERAVLASFKWLYTLGTAPTGFVLISSVSSGYLKSIYP